MAKAGGGRKAVLKGVVVSAAHIERAILIVRGHKVLLDAELAGLYEVQTRALVEAVKRKSNRFPVDFMFQLTDQEFQHLKSKFVISSLPRQGGAEGAVRPMFSRSRHGHALLRAQ